jgi:hypothetical protein
LSVRNLAARVAFAVAAALVFGALSGETRADRRAAENQYRVARRLAAQRSPEAAAALRRVVELDPKGPLADDALLDLADLEGVPLVPEQLGRVSLAAARRALAVLEELLRDHDSADRATEARIRRALLMLEPLPIQNTTDARVDLLGVATAGSGDDLSPLARYCVAWLDERQGNIDRARAAYQRLVIDSAGDPIAVFSRVGLGRTAARLGEFAAASRWLQEAVALEPPVETGAIDLRELAVRGLLRSAGGAGWKTGSARTMETGIRGPEELVRLSGGGRLVVDRKKPGVVRLGANGRPVAQWELDGVDALAVDPFGRVFVAADENILRLVDDQAVPTLSIAGTAPVDAMAVDSEGSFWLVERKGDRLVRINALGEVETVWTGGPEKLVDIVWDGQRIVALDGRGDQLMVIERDGEARVLHQIGFGKPTRISSDGIGQVAVLDARSAKVVLVGPAGSVREQLSTDAVGAARPVSIGLGPGGSLDIIDGSNGLLVNLP